MFTVSKDQFYPARVVKFDTWPEVVHYVKHVMQTAAYVTKQDEQGILKVTPATPYFTDNKVVTEWVADHQCLIQETPDGMGCVTCLYT